MGESAKGREILKRAKSDLSASKSGSEDETEANSRQAVSFVTTRRVGREEKQEGGRGTKERVWSLLSEGHLWQGKEED